MWQARRIASTLGCPTLLVAALLLAACRLHTNDAEDADAELDDALAERAFLLADMDACLLFLTSEPDAPAIGFGSADAKLVARDDPSDNGRIPVRVLGRLHTEGYVPDGCVELYVQENTQLAGTPVVLRAGDRVGLVEPRTTPQCTEFKRASPWARRCSDRSRAACRPTCCRRGHRRLRAS